MIDNILQSVLDVKLNNEVSDSFEEGSVFAGDEYLEDTHRIDSGDYLVRLKDDNTLYIGYFSTNYFSGCLPIKDFTIKEFLESPEYIESEFKQQYVQFFGNSPHEEVDGVKIDDIVFIMSVEEFNKIYFK